MIKQRLPDVLSPNRRVMPLATCAILVFSMALASQLPPISLHADSGTRADHALVVHTVLEMFSIIVSVLVVIVSWQRLDALQSSDSNLLVCGFSLVAGLDMLHMLSYQGMPMLVTESSPSKAIFFWLAGRFFELSTVVLLAANLRLPGPRHRWFALALLATAGFAYVGIYHLNLLPETFVPGAGVTRFKALCEYALCAGNLATAVWLWRHALRDPKGQSIHFALACFAMSVGGLAFSRYVTPSDFMNMLGHIYKVVAYGFVFWAAFVAGLRQPYEKLALSERQLASRQRELETLLSNVPVGVMRIDRDSRFRYVNSTLERITHISADRLLGKRMPDTGLSHVWNLTHASFAQAMQGRQADLDCQFNGANGLPLHWSVSVVPERDDAGLTDTVLAIVTDVTDRTRARSKLQESQNEIADLKAALDAHAIVAVTNARGVITRVNDKFCEISRYCRDELIGQTHQLINSGFHPQEFFSEIWHSISLGLVWNGEICNRGKDRSLYWVFTTIVPFLDKHGVPVQYIAISADITKRKKAEQEVQRMALHDSLTGLPNRRLMHDRLRQAVAHATRDRGHGALLMLDLDNFKEINDTLGHAHGDELLRQVAERLNKLVRQSDTVARLGGDEFIVILTDLGADPDSAIQHAGDLSERIRIALGESFTLFGHAVPMSSSIGVVMFQCDEDSELLKQADMALYKAKEAGRNRVRFFDPSLQADINARSELMRDLRQAQHSGELRLYYQPVVDAEQRIVGVEALLRWLHPVRGMVSPADFIPIAEQTGLISPLGQWVLESACTQLRAWAEDDVRKEWTLAVNVSARQFHEPEFVAQVKRALSGSGANPHRLRLELTESMLHSDLTETGSKMTALRSLGVRFSLDDFGTGYSSLSYLSKLPLDQLKIDKSFVSDVLTNENDAAIARTILSLANILDLNVVAEGVETTEQFLFLKRHGCQAFQGYLFSRPVPIALLPDQLTSSHLLA